MSKGQQLDVLNRRQCLDLLQGVRVGRLVFTEDDLPAVHPVNFRLWRDNSQHPSLHFKPVGLYWSVRVGLEYRALAVKHEDTYVWFWIGHHSVYDRLIS